MSPFLYKFSQSAYIYLKTYTYDDALVDHFALDYYIRTRFNGLPTST